MPVYFTLWSLFAVLSEVKPTDWQQRLLLIKEKTTRLRVLDGQVWSGDASLVQLPACEQNFLWIFTILTDQRLCSVFCYRLWSKLYFYSHTPSMHTNLLLLPPCVLMCMDVCTCVGVIACCMASGCSRIYLPVPNSDCCCVSKLYLLFLSRVV